MMKVEEAASASAGARRSLPLRVRAQVVHGLVAFKGARSVLLSCPGGLSSLLLFPAALRFLEARRRPHGVLVAAARAATSVSSLPPSCRLYFHFTSTPVGSACGCISSGDLFAPSSDARSTCVPVGVPAPRPLFLDDLRPAPRPLPPRPLPPRPPPPRPSCIIAGAGAAAARRAGGMIPSRRVSLVRVLRAICGRFGESSSGAARRAYAIRARELSLSPLFSSWKFRQELSGCFLSGGNQCNGQCRELESPFGGAVCGSYDNEEGL